MVKIGDKVKEHEYGNVGVVIGFDTEDWLLIMAEDCLDTDMWCVEDRKGFTKRIEDCYCGIKSLYYNYVGGIDFKTTRFLWCSPDEITKL